MAVKVMVAPVIAKGDVGKPARKAAVPRKQAAPRPKRRRSSVFDAEGNEVFITLMCLKCQKIRPLSQFGLRRMADGAIRNQPWCRSCRSAPAAGDESARARRAGSPEAGESPVAEGSPEVAEPAATAADTATASERPRPRSVAAEVAAALAGGRG
jgi:hypothetical protein